MIDTDSKLRHSSTSCLYKDRCTEIVDARPTSRSFLKRSTIRLRFKGITGKRRLDAIHEKSNWYSWQGRLILASLFFLANRYFLQTSKYALHCPVFMLIVIWLLSFLLFCDYKWSYLQLSFWKSTLFSNCQMEDARYNKSMVLYQPIKLH